MEDSIVSGNRTFVGGGIGRGPHETILGTERSTPQFGMRVLPLGIMFHPILKFNVYEISITMPWSKCSPNHKIIVVWGLCLVLPARGWNGTAEGAWIEHRLLLLDRPITTENIWCWVKQSALLVGR
jgi:hypothetical protein